MNLITVQSDGGEVMNLMAVHCTIRRVINNLPATRIMATWPSIWLLYTTSSLLYSLRLQNRFLHRATNWLVVCQLELQHKIEKCVEKCRSSRESITVTNELFLCHYSYWFCQLSAKILSSFKYIYRCSWLYPTTGYWNSLRWFCLN